MVKVAIAGSTGFVGRNLIEFFIKNSEIEIHALSRRVRFNTIDEATSIHWKKCDLFSQLELENALEGCDVAIYLIHSMLPTARLSQGSFRDFDLCLADNFAHAAKKCGIKQIIYLSGLISGENLSEHLQSRLEVEEILSQTDIPLTTLRAGMIVGENGSSFQILTKLVNRLPVMICPAWTLNKTQPIDIKDVIKLIHSVIMKPEHFNKSYDIAGSSLLTYKEMLDETAKALNKKRYYLNFPFFTPTLSRLWVRLITGSPKELVYPLISSLKNETIINPQNELALEEKISFQDSLKRTLSKKKGLVSKKINVPAVFQFNLNFKWLHSVRSIQRMKLPIGFNAQRISAEYFKWLSSFFSPYLKVEENHPNFYFTLFSKIKLLNLSYNSQRSSDQRYIFYITGGLLQRKRAELKGRLEFRIIKNKYLLVAIHDFQPTLPWFIYKFTQAIFHLYVMRKFEQHLRDLNETT